MVAAEVLERELDELIFGLAADGARAYLADVPDAELHLLDTGHFALATHAGEVANLIAAFHAKRRAGARTTAAASS